MTTDSMTAHGRAGVLADGNQMPTLGLGVWQVPDGPECVRAVRWALELGYRHIDTAQAYGNEEASGGRCATAECPATRYSSLPSRFPDAKTLLTRPSGAFDGSASIGSTRTSSTGPQGGPTWAWPGIERARELWYGRSVGVSNFSLSDLDKVIGAAAVAPAVNQVQFRPFKYRRALLDACQQWSLALKAYNPLGTGGTSPARRSIRSRGASAGRPHRCFCAGAFSVSFRSSPSRHIESPSRRTRGSSISPCPGKDMAELDALDETGGTDRALERQWR